MLERINKLEKVFINKQLDSIKKIISKIENEGNGYKIVDLWTFDQTIEEIGGYC